MHNQTNLSGVDPEMKFAMAGGGEGVKIDWFSSKNCSVAFKFVMFAYSISALHVHLAI